MGAGGGSEAEIISVKIDVDAGPVDVAKGKLAEAQALVRGLKDGGRIPTVIEVDTANAKANVADLTSKIKGLEKAQKDANALAVKGFKYQKAAEAEDAAKSAALYDQAGSALASGAGLALKAALAIGAATVAMVAGGVKMGIEATASKQKNIAVLDRLTKGQGELAESVSKQLAGETGVDEDKAMERVKSLIQAKFDRADTEIVFKASADIGATLGEGKADAFLAILEKVQHEGVATEKALKGLSGVGLDRSAVIEGLRQTGESAEAASARLKAGKVSAGEFAKAASAAAAKDFGGVAGKDLDATFNRAKIAAGDLFDGMDEGLESVKGLGSLITDALSGEDGAKLKAGITEAGNAVLNLAKNITAEDIKGAITGIADAASKMAKAIGDAADYAHELSISWKEVSGANAQEGEDIERQIKAQTDRAQIRYEKEQKAKEALAAAGSGVKDQAAAGGDNSGKALADGVAKGIEDNAGKPAAAAAAMMKGTIAAADAAAKIKSPSRAMFERGDYLAQGAEGGIRANAWKPERAASDMMGRTVRAAPAGGGGGGPTGGGAVAGGASSIILNVYQTLPPGSPEATRDAAREGVSLSYAALLPLLRQAARDGQLIVGGQ